ncbi:hypothetical protein ALI144C_45700 [Actinosynnema sp. ALI-1.44]|uniref:hypothetical protein n=1 Tax=Actinosynnema sp. ALI-1.44 TaxID=1933779 RepID=UPI00097BA8BA|nr:hypothetical protein [Actinosynnema sp. ALI-1.44]ONI73222.1 hypothetical protein ALI144C_45700 [Actinosynnema sp. ALI-1.44]
MLYLLAAVGALTVAVLLWRAFGAQAAAGVAARRERGVIAPDDDPEFLKGLAERNKKAGEDPPA